VGIPGDVLALTIADWVVLGVLAVVLVAGYTGYGIRGRRGQGAGE
jgi:hypothetical protein